MPNIATIKISYQHCEEVLATTGIYELDGGVTAISQGTIAVEELAFAVVANIVDLRAIMGANDKVVAVDVTMPADIDTGWGPWGYHRPQRVAGTDANRLNKLTDMIAAQIIWTGQNEVDEKVRNAKFWSCLTPLDVDCMELSGPAIAEITAAFNDLFPVEYAVSAGTFRRVVSNTRAGVPGLVTYHPCTSVAASAVVASVGNRRGDITPRRGKLVTAP